MSSVFCYNLLVIYIKQDYFIEELTMRLLFEMDKRDYSFRGSYYIRPSARALIMKDNKLAIIYSQKERFCKIPGGGIEMGEDPQKAMIREVKEESGLIVKEDSIKEFGYVHRIEKGSKEDLFIQDNYYYICDVEEVKIDTRYTENERKHDFIPQFLEPEEVIRINEEYLKDNPEDNMIVREVKVIRQFIEEIL